MHAFIATLLNRRTMRRGMRAAALERIRPIRHDCSQHYGEGRWYSDGSLRFTCGLCKCTKRAMPPRNWSKLLIVAAFWALIVGAIVFLFTT